MHFDEWQQATDFSLGEQVVRPYGLVTSPLRGQVVAIHPKINKLDVQWPTQTMRMDPWDVVSVSAVAVASAVAEKLRPVVEAAKQANVVGAALRQHLHSKFPAVTVSHLDAVILAVRKQGQDEIKPDIKDFREQSGKNPAGKANWVFDVGGESRAFENMDYEDAAKMVGEYAKGKNKRQVKLVGDGKP